MMAKARHHYMADWFYPDPGSADGLRIESGRIIAYDDAEAVKEAAPFAVNSSFYLIRKVTKTSNVVIYDSRRVPHA